MRQGIHSRPCFISNMGSNRWSPAFLSSMRVIVVMGMLVAVVVVVAFVRMIPRAMRMTMPAKYKESYQI